MIHLKFREQLVRDLIVLFHEENIEVYDVPKGRPSISETQMSRLDAKHSFHWVAKEEDVIIVCAK
jgi:hypothetical protein